MVASIHLVCSDRCQLRFGLYSTLDVAILTERNSSSMARPVGSNVAFAATVEMICICLISKPGH